MVYRFMRGVGGLLFPPVCLLCGADAPAGRDLCTGCAQDLPRLGVSCPRCALPLALEEDAVCGRCRRSPPAYDRILAPFHYERPLNWLIPRLKFDARLAHARLLGGLMADFLQQRLKDEELPELIIPVPLHRARLRRRGFNQALEIARPVARRLDLRLEPHALRRVRSTSAQMDLPARKRRANIRGAFALREGWGAAHVALVDDVATTGATVNELAKVLKRAGVERVQVWVCARAL